MSAASVAAKARQTLRRARAASIPADAIERLEACVLAAEAAERWGLKQPLEYAGNGLVQACGLCWYPFVGVSVGVSVGPAEWDYATASPLLAVLEECDTGEGLDGDWARMIADLRQAATEQACYTTD